MKNVCLIFFLINVYLVGNIHSYAASSVLLDEIKKTNTYNFSIEFEGFKPSEVSDFAAYYRQYTGFISDEIVSQSASYTKVLYRVDAKRETIMSNLQKTADVNGYEVLLRNAEHKIHIKLLAKNQRSLKYQEW